MIYNMSITGKEDISMKYSKRETAYVLCMLLSAGVFGGCAGSSDSESGAALTDTSISLNESETAVSMIGLSEEPIEAPDITNSVNITLSGSAASVSGSGAKTENGVVTITSGGTYVISGEMTEGQIIVNAPKSEVTLVLQNADISCSYGSPLYIYDSKLTTVYLSEGTKNTLTDGSEYTFGDSLSSAADEEPNACLYSKSDLVIAGSGELIVNAGYNNGITGKDTLKIDSCSLNVTAKNNGINGKDFCVINNADIIVSCGGDAIRSTNDSDKALGYINIAESSLELTAGEDGIQAETALAVTGGSCKIISGGGSGGNDQPDISAKGIKGGSDVTLTGGEYTLDCLDDAVHSNGNVLISGGTFEISSADDGIHADEKTAVTGGSIGIIKSYEGIEGGIVDISGGTIKISARDDGINAAGGADQSGFGPRMDMFSGSSDYYINISGGIITVDAAGDGVDANGSLTVSGGELYVSGSENNGNGALDYDGSAAITGGIVVAAGASGMAQNFGSDSTQGSILLTYTDFSSDKIVLKDSSGNILASYTPSKKYNCVVISCPSVTQGNTYTVESGGQTNSVTMSSLIYGETKGMGFGKGDHFGRPDGKEFPGGRGQMKEPPEGFGEPPESSTSSSETYSSE